MYINKTNDTAPVAGKLTANTFTTGDGAVLYYKDWGSGPAVVFSHGYPLSSGICSTWCEHGGAL